MPMLWPCTRPTKMRKRQAGVRFNQNHFSPINDASNAFFTNLMLLQKHISAPQSTSISLFCIKDYTRIPDNCRPCEIDNWASPVPGGISTTSISSFPQETPLVNFWSALITWKDRIQINPCEKYIELYKLRSASCEGKKQYTDIWIDF